MKNIATIGRIIFALPFAILGLNHFFMVDYYTGLLTSFTPGGGFTILFVGAVMIAASIAIMLKKFVQLACYILAILLLAFILTIHVPNLFDPDHTKSVLGMIELLKDSALMGGALVIGSMFKEK
jgi:putative oxidoreductase